MKIAFVAQPEYFRFIYENDLDFIGEVREFVFNYTMSEKNFTALEEYNPDISFFFRGEYFPNEVLKRLNGIKINLSSEPFPNTINDKLNYSLDSLRRYKNFRKIISKSFDYVFHYDKSSLQFIKNDGINISGEFYFPVATGTYRKIDIPKRWDFFFIGRSTPYREKYFFHLKHYYNFLHICHGIWGKELVTYTNQSKILLNIHAEKEISWEPRVQMLMATGKMLISEKLTENPYLIPGEDYIEISTPKELINKAEYYLEHEDEREEIANNGMKKILELFDSKNIFSEFIKNIKKGDYNKMSVSSSQSTLLKLQIIAILKQIGIQTKEILKEII
jgi:hypothetical protein